MKSRKAISSVVGAVFGIIALSTTIGYVTYSMNVLDQYNQSILVTNANALDRNKEQIQVTGVTIDSNKFNITANNIGSIPVHLTRLWVTNTTDVGKVFRYNIDYSLAPGQSQIKIGQSLPIYAKTNQAYDIKLITDRGNVKEFTVNSVGTAPLNIQLLALPPSVASGFKTQLVMTVTNNGSSTLTNLVPVLTPNGVPTATCTPDPVNSPAKYSTLTPGSTAIFSWAVSATGTQDGQTCKFGAQLQNGYNKNFGNATITVTTVLLASTDYAANAGVMTIDYKTFHWTKGVQWNTGWDISPCSASCNHAFQLTLQNNNKTTGSTFYISKNSLMIFWSTASAGGGTDFYIVNSTDPSTMNSQAYTGCNGVNDYCQKIPYQGTLTLTFDATAAGGTSGSKLATGQYMGFIVLFGKFSTSQTDGSGKYAQNIPFMASWVA